MPHAHKDPTAPPALTVEGAADRLAPRYRVAAVEARTGIPASTLRSWERRYGFPRPLRTATGQRLYSDHDVALIRFLARQRAEGLSIGQVTALLRQAGTEADPEQLLERLIRALGAFDEAGAERCFAAAVRLLGLEGAALALVELAIGAIAEGAGDVEGGGRVAAEHFASEVLRRELLRLLDAFPPGRGQPLLVACGPEEQHELGALLLRLLLRARGHHVVYLGPRLPGPVLARAAAALDPAGLAVSLTMGESLERTIGWLRRDRPSALWALALPGAGAVHGSSRLWWGGQALLEAAEAAGHLPGEVVTGSAADGADTIDRGLRRRGPR